MMNWLKQAAQKQVQPPSATTATTSAGARGMDAEARALAHLQQHGLRLLQRNFRVARGPRARAGEIDLVMRDATDTVVFVEVRTRTSRSQGGAAASITAVKQRRLILAAQHYLAGLPVLPPCRFDVVAIDGENLEWLQGAFSAPG